MGVRLHVTWHATWRAMEREAWANIYCADTPLVRP
jgi:hypothetical protein